MKKSSYTIGALVILLIAAIAFIFTPGMFGGFDTGAGPKFGSYDGTGIRYDQNSDYSNYVALYADYYKENGRDLSDSQYEIFYNAFISTVNEIASKKALVKSHWTAPSVAVNRIIRNRFLDKNGKFDKKAYNSTPSDSIQQLSNSIEKDLTGRQFNQDNFGTQGIGKTQMYGLKATDNELSFLKDMNKARRSFNMAVFNMNDYPDSEKEAYAKANADKFKKFDLDVITLKSKKEADDLLAKINSKEVTFADSVAKSDKSYSNSDGKFRYDYSYQITPIFKNADDAKKLETLKKDELSAVFETTIGFSFFKANAEAAEPDYKNSDFLKTVNNYLVQNDYSHVQDYYTETAKAFATVAEKSGFAAACKQFNVEKTDVPSIALNYGNESVLEKLPSIKGLEGAYRNEEFFKTAFSLELNKISAPVIINRNVIVLQYVKASENTEAADDDVLKSELTSYSAQDCQKVIMSSPKLVDNFTQTYFSQIANH